MDNASRLIETRGFGNVRQCVFSAVFSRRVCCSVPRCVGVCTIMRVIEGP